jgi:hypothetical protein
MWDVFAPPTTTTVSYPILPAEFGLEWDPLGAYFISTVSLVDVIGIDRKTTLGLIERNFAFELLAADPSIRGIAMSTIEGI